MMIQSRCKFKLKRFRCRLGKEIATCLTYTTLVLGLVFMQYDYVSAFEPDFVFPLENVTIAQGRDATFTCVVNNLGGYRVSGESGSPARVRITFPMHVF
ncbi:hypothetical protein PVAND_013076 [Polypedilum vanderplanki]|uniref:Lachesin n=1 Tax=Polypedilum vanderplanki TaxID=319348 RepID=A0A9J6CPJ0_POLVA|nr:hypothetical protein PVAND_013076 [Polypedilum vanderplanki]